MLYTVYYISVLFCKRFKASIRAPLMSLHYCVTSVTHSCVVNGEVHKHLSMTTPLLISSTHQMFYHSVLLSNHRLISSDSRRHNAITLTPSRRQTVSSSGSALCHQLHLCVFGCLSICSICLFIYIILKLMLNLMYFTL